SRLAAMSSATSSGRAPAKRGTRTTRQSAAYRPPASKRAISRELAWATRPWPLVVRSRVSSCMRMTTPSPVSLASNSTHRAPRRRASLMLSSVFSGAYAEAPRCPITLGNRKSPMARSEGATSTGRFGLPRDVLARRLVDRLHAELDLAAVIHADDLYLDEVPDFHAVGHGRHALRRQFADVDEAVAAAKEVHEGAEVHDLHALAAVDDADLRFRDDAADPIDCGLGGLGIDGRHFDSAVVFDIDLGAGDFADLANHLPARTDDLTDLVLGNGDHGDPRRVLADHLARG